MNLEDALGGTPWPGGSGGNSSGSGGAQPPNPTWPGGTPNAGNAWPSQPPAGGNGAWPGQPGTGAWPAQPGGGAWPAQPGGGAWPAQPGGGTWPGPTPAGGGGTWPGPTPAGGGGAWPGPTPAGGGGTWPGPTPAGGPGTWPSPSPGPGPSIPTAPQQSLTVPYSQTLPNGVCNKFLITIVGTIKHNPDKITVDLSTGHDVAFHFNPRFNEGGKKVIVRNSNINKTWGREERELSHFPFVPGQRFELKIMCTDHEFKVAVNSSHLMDFKHRVHNLRSINILNIYNDVTLSSVNLEKLP